MADAASTVRKTNMNPKHENVHTNVKEETETDTKTDVKHEVKDFLFLNDNKALVKREKSLKPEPSWGRYISFNLSSVKSDVPKTEKETRFKSEAIHAEHIESKKGPQYVSEFKTEKSGEESDARNVESVKVASQLKEHSPTKNTLQYKICNKKYKTKRLLKDHEFLHSDIKPFKCDLCPRAYYRQSCLKVHKAIHKGEKPFECNFCHERFILKTYLSGHLRKHTGERPYGCDQCDKAYKWKSHLRDHIADTQW